MRQLLILLLLLLFIIILPFFIFERLLSIPYRILHAIMNYLLKISDKLIIKLDKIDGVGK